MSGATTQNTIEKRYDELMNLPGGGGVQANPDRYRAHPKALPEIRPIVEKSRDYKAVESAIGETRERAGADGELRELVPRNVAALTDAPRHRPREIEPLTPEQAKTLLATVADHRLGALVTVAVGLGLGQGEALGLRWEDVDLDAGVLSVRQTLDRAGTTPRFGEPKTRRSRRSISVPDVVTTALRRHRTRQLEERLAAGARWRDSGLVFTTTIGTPVDRGRLHKIFKAMLRSAGLPDIRYHDLRHTAATLLLAQGVDPRTIMETLGHSQMSLTLNTYAHVMPALQREAAAKMDAILTPAAATPATRSS